MKRVLSSAAVLAAGAVLLAGCAGSSTAAPASPTQVGITAHGSATVSGTPDTLTIVLGVQTQADTAAAALSQANEQAGNVINTLKSRGVTDKDIQTSQLSINPSYDPTGNRIIGYQVSNQVTVTMHNSSGSGDLADSGSVIDAAARSAGDAIRVQSVNFSIADDGTLRAKAREQAVKQAKDQAGQMASAAGVHLGKLLSITENPSSAPPPMPMYSQRAGVADAVPIQPGSEQLTVTVDVVYDINQ